MENFFPILTFVFVAVAIISIYWFFESRQKSIVVRERLLSSRGKRGRSPGDLFRNVLTALGSHTMPRQEKNLREIKKRLLYAGFRENSAIALYFGIRTLLPLVFAFLFILFLTTLGRTGLRDLIQIIFPLSVGYYLPNFILQAGIKRRNKKIFRELPDTLDLLVICIEAGLGFEAALFRVSRELEEVAPILSQEFARYFLETQSGIPRNQALISIKEKNSEDGLRSVVDVLLQSVRFGTDVAAGLRVHSEDMRVRRRQIAEEKGAKVATKLTLPLIALILPVLLIIILGPAAVRLIERLRGTFF